MIRNRNVFAILSVTAALLLVFFVANAAAQSIVSGDISGTVTDPSGAVVSGATVTIKNNATGAVQTTTTNATGFYRFSLLKPATYVVTVTQTGFQTTTRTVQVSVGQVTRADAKLTVGQSSQTVEVTAQTPVIQTDNGNVQSSFNAAQIDALPNPGGDITYVAQTAPGINVNASSGGGYGNFTANGTPGNANLFTVNGNDNMDPYLNLNNSGASNLTLGANELQDATVTTNGYTGEFGRNAGAQLNYGTKSGTNALHGNLSYLWTGAALNARDWFNNGPNPNSASQQWAASVGGPIVKDKIFFFLNTEGLHLKLPTSQNVFIPSPQYQAFTVNSGLPGVGAANQIPFYQKMFGLWNGATGAATSGPVTDLANLDLGCGAPAFPLSSNPAGPPVLGYDNSTPTGVAMEAAGFGTTVPCANQFRSSALSPSREWILSGRFDVNFSEADKVFFRVNTDQGTQATYTDPINPIFNAISKQPQYGGQANWSHTLSNNSVNQLIVSGSYYSAIFKSVNQAAALQAFPYAFSGVDQFTQLGGQNFNFPQGRNVSQWQVVDDFSLTKGKHTLKFGVNYRGNRVTSYRFSVLTTPQVLVADVGSFAGGTWDQFRQRFPVTFSRPFRLYSLGFYVQDQLRVTPKLSLTLAVRADHNSNPNCPQNCFARASGTFQQFPHDVNIPYNQTIQTGLSEAFNDFETLAWQPRIGFAWTPFSNQNTVIRGGVGIFADAFPATITDDPARNPPFSNDFRTLGANAAPDVPGSAQTQLAAVNQAFVNGFNTGQTLAQIQAALPPGIVGFRPPGLNTYQNNLKNPKWIKWNLEFQHALDNKTSVSLNYIGNHGRDIFTAVNPNTFCRTASACSGFAPLVAPDPRFGTVTQLYNQGVSNYNGVVASFTRRYSSLQIQASYTWSHTLDDISNGGILPYSLNDSITVQINPANLSSVNYGNADYDARHYFNGSYTWTPGFKFENSTMNRVLGGWTLSQTFFTRTGLPFSVYDSSFGTTTLRNYGASPGGGPAAVLFNFVPGFQGGAPTCNGPRNAGDVCLNSTDFPQPATFVGNQRRNQFRGPGFFDTDISLSKNFKVTERVSFGVGANVFNVLNHPNFANPAADLGGSGFGTILNTVAIPTSPFGTFVGAAASGRLIQLNARINF